eukprot:TRINITY_DN2266_c0_g2_i1.p1 TRINITY_DN2266_c0_g2~~TRINITY_DN2266_c0_g2_i1.p1  ORF type:complete len:675 (+),score=123.27 TRINITY_DN2266_c0_g2_i1:2-2026(+)
MMFVRFAALFVALVAVRSQTAFPTTETPHWASPSLSPRDPLAALNATLNAALQQFAAGSNSTTTLASLVRLLEVLNNLTVVPEEQLEARNQLRVCVLQATALVSNATGGPQYLLGQLDLLQNATNMSDSPQNTWLLLCALLSRVAATAGQNGGLTPTQAAALLNAQAAVLARIQQRNTTSAALPCLSALGANGTLSLPCFSFARVVAAVAAAVANSTGTVIIPVAGSNGSIVVYSNQDGTGSVRISVPSRGVDVQLSGQKGAIQATITVSPSNIHHDGDPRTVVVSPVVSIVLLDSEGNEIGLNGTTAITIPPASNATTAACGSVAVCSYWDESCACWKSDGVQTIVTSEEDGTISNYTCVATHLTDFAVLLVATEEKNCSSETLFDKFHHLFAGFSIMYAIFFAGTSVQASRAFLFAKQARTGTTSAWLRVAMLSSAAAGLFSRMLYTALAASGALTSASVLVLAVLLSMPYYFLFLAFVFVLGQWATMTSSSSTLSTPVKLTMGGVVLIISAVLCLTFLAVGTASTPERQKSAAAIGSYILAGCCIGLACGFVGFGGRMIFHTMRFAASSSTSMAILHKLYFVTCAYSLAFVLEACLWIVSILALDRFRAHFRRFYIAFLLLELLTYATLLFATRKFASATAKTKPGTTGASNISLRPTQLSYGQVPDEAGS